jgi:outer membrane protein OmpA-like peptidoglycan-associated protein
MRKLILLIPILIFCAFDTDSWSYVLDDIRFDPNASELTGEQVQELTAIVKTIRTSLAESNHKTFTLWINGNADQSERNTKQLAASRARQVKAQLLSLGLTEGKLVAKGYGTRRPLTDSSTAEKKKRNARVDFQIRLE